MSDEIEQLEEMLAPEEPETQIGRLIAEIADMNKAKGWREDNEGSRSGYEFPAYIALLHSEASEALEAYRDKNIHGDATWSWTTPAGKPMGVGPELADVLIRVLDMCDIWDIDIEAELERVIKYNKTRPYQHGGRTL
jgi:NTP pyrophosphatase (non-canonical NTP hydrolase)